MTLVLDLNASTVKGIGRETTLEYAIRAAASIARCALEQGYAAQLFAHGKQPRHIPPGRGTRHLHTILEELTSWTADGRIPMEELLPRLLPYGQAGSTFAIVLNHLGLDLKKYIDALVTLRAKGVSTWIVLIDERSFLNLREGITPDAVPLLHLPEMLEILSNLGIPVYTVRRGEALAERLSHTTHEAPAGDLPAAGSVSVARAMDGPSRRLPRKNDRRSF
jgi:uncharacterized protein (DUF58 family)